MAETVDRVFGETEVSYEMPRVFEALSERLETSQIDLAGKLMVEGLDLLRPLEWAIMSRLDAPTHRIFGDNPDGPARSAKELIPWDIPTEVWQGYLDWCNASPVNVPGIVEATFKASLASAVEREGKDFINWLGIKNYSHIRRGIDSDMFWRQHGGGGCLDREPYGVFGGGCIDREPTW